MRFLLTRRWVLFALAVALLALGCRTARASGSSTACTTASSATSGPRDEPRRRARARSTDVLSAVDEPCPADREWLRVTRHRGVRRRRDRRGPLPDPRRRAGCRPRDAAASPTPAPAVLVDRGWVPTANTGTVPDRPACAPVRDRSTSSAGSAPTPPADAPWSRTAPPGRSRASAIGETLDYPLYDGLRRRRDRGPGAGRPSWCGPSCPTSARARTSSTGCSGGSSGCSPSSASATWPGTSGAGASRAGSGKAPTGEPVSTHLTRRRPGGPRAHAPAPRRRPRASSPSRTPRSITTLRADGQPVSVATWYLLDGDRLLVNMDATRKRLEHLRHDPRVVADGARRGTTGTPTSASSGRVVEMTRRRRAGRHRPALPALPRPALPDQEQPAGQRLGRDRAVPRLGCPEAAPAELSAHDGGHAAGRAASSGTGCGRARRRGRPRASSLVGAEPDCTIRPSSRTRIWSALRTVESRWAMTSEVRPSSAVSSARCTAASDSESRWAVASSSTTIARRLEQQPGDGQPLPLAAGEPVAAVAHDRVEPVGQRSRRAGGSARPRAPRHSSRVVGVGPGVEQVGPDRVVEHVRVLGDVADRVLQRLQRQVADVDAAHPHGATGDVVQPRDEVGDGGLAGARRARPARPSGRARRVNEMSCSTSPESLVSLRATASRLASDTSSARG